MEHVFDRGILWTKGEDCARPRVETTFRPDRLIDLPAARFAGSPSHAMCFLIQLATRSSDIVPSAIASQTRTCSVSSAFRSDPLSRRKVSVTTFETLLLPSTKAWFLASPTA